MRGSAAIEVNEKLRILREQARLSQSELAKILEIDRSDMSRIESGKKKPSRSVLFKYSKFFETDLNDLAPEQMAVYSIRLPKKMVQELMTEFEYLGNDFSTIVRNVLHEALDTNCFEKQQALLVKLIYNAISEKSKDEIQSLKKNEVNMEFLKMAIMECFAQLLHASETDKEELAAMLMKNARSLVYKK
ncbi:MAG: helix-turn-helix transcriptional regulator [Erysipelotrichaceae bacterium]|nr:helix-turn-helix transcriptional regulator [Erysipelotrichaceae bacterium]